LKVIIVHQGKTSDKSLFQTENDYIDRLSHYIPLKVVYLPEHKSSNSIASILAFEEANLFKLIKPTDLLLLFDEKGNTFSSKKFAEHLQKLFFSGKNLFLATGGPYGFSEGIYKRADGLISLSSMTFTHQMVRVIIAEQLYRAFTILKNEKYHH